MQAFIPTWPAALRAEAQSPAGTPLSLAGYRLYNDDCAAPELTRASAWRVRSRHRRRPSAFSALASQARTNGCEADTLPLTALLVRSSNRLSGIGRRRDGRVEGTPVQETDVRVQVLLRRLHSTLRPGAHSPIALGRSHRAFNALDGVPAPHAPSDGQHRHAMSPNLHHAECPQGIGPMRRNPAARKRLYPERYRCGDSNDREHNARVALIHTSLQRSWAGRAEGPCWI